MIGQQTIDILPKVEQFLRGTKKLYIGGEWVEAVSGKTFETAT